MTQHALLDIGCGDHGREARRAKLVVPLALLPLLVSRNCVLLYKLVLKLKTATERERAGPLMPLVPGQPEALVRIPVA